MHRAITVLSVVLVLALPSAAATETMRPTGTARHRAVETCNDARKAIRYYRAITWEYQGKLNEKRYRTTYPERHRGQCGYKRYVVSVWKTRASKEREAYRRYLYDYAWWIWLPDKWRRIAKCETSLRWDWDSGTHVSAFGITRTNYAKDAQAIGLPSWDAPGKRTPREQYDTALSHYRLHYGFSGWGCRNA